MRKLVQRYQKTMRPQPNTESSLPRLAPPLHLAPHAPSSSMRPAQPRRLVTSASLVMGQNEPRHALRRHGRSTPVSGPAGPAVGASGSGHNRTHQSQEGKKGSQRSRGSLPSYHYRMIFRSRPFLTNDGTPRMTILNYHRSDVMAVESEPPIPVDVNALREDVKSKYREVAIDPHGKYHFHTGRYLAKHLGYDDKFAASLPDVAVESFAGVANPFSLQTLPKGEHVVDVGSGGGF